MTGYKSKKAAAQGKLAEQQEPVAWYHDDFGTLELSRIQRVGWKPLYAAPANRTPLTVEEVKKLIHPIVMADLSDEMTDFEIVRAIEAAHGIKE